jgi:taurine--2-oxoglutarate transaminase
MTYSGHPVSCAAGVAAIETYKKEGLVDNAREMGMILKKKLENLKEKHPCVGDVRSIGLFSCLELVKNKETREPIDPKQYAKKLSKLLLDKGLFSSIAGIQQAIYLYVCPPLIINQEELDEGLNIIDDVLNYVDTLTLT